MFGLIPSEGAPDSHSFFKSLALSLGFDSFQIESLTIRSANALKNFETFSTCVFGLNYIIPGKLFGQNKSYFGNFLEQ